jgi:hypothetical protein
MALNVTPIGKAPVGEGLRLPPAGRDTTTGALTGGADLFRVPAGEPGRRRPGRFAVTAASGGAHAVDSFVLVAAIARLERARRRGRIQPTDLRRSVAPPGSMLFTEPVLRHTSDPEGR